MNWHEYALSIPALPSTETEARAAYAAELARIERDVDAVDQDEARAALGDTWGEAAVFKRWTLTA